MKNYINLFGILGEKGELGLIDYLKNTTPEELKILSNQYDVPKKIKIREEVIKSILWKVERTMNIGYVFSDKHKKVELIKLYK